NAAAAQSPDGVAAQVRLFASGADYIPVYPAGGIATTRRFAAAHPRTLLAFIWAIIDAQELFLDPASAPTAIASLARTDRLDAAAAQDLYRRTAASIGALTPEAQVREDMVQAVLDIRAEVGLLAEPTPPTSRYVTPEWYALALSLR